MRGNYRKQQGLSLGEIREVAARFPRAAVTGPAAAIVMGLPTLGWVEAVDLRYLSGAKPGKQPKDPRVVYRGGSMRQDLVQERNGVRTAHPIQVLFDIYRYYGRLDALVPIEHLRYHCQVTQEALMDSAKSVLPRANGIRGFEGLVGWSAGTSQSALETIGRDTVLRAEIPEAHTFEFQVEVVFEDIFAQQRFASVDMMINGWLAVEFDGRIKSDGTYGDGVTVLLNQLDRQHEIQALGFSVVRAGWRDVVSGKLVRDLRRMLRARREAA